MVELKAAVGKCFLAGPRVHLPAVLRPNLHRRRCVVAGTHYVGEGPVGALAVLHSVLAAELLSTRGEPWEGEDLIKVSVMLRAR